MSVILKEVVGHKKLIQSYETAIQQGRLHSTQLLTGPHGIGKRKVALGLAQALICEKSTMACGECPACQRVSKEQSESLLMIKPQSVQIKMDQAREIIQFFSLQRVGAARVVIIDQAELLNVQAANALLKTLEEPPPQSYIFLLASSATSVLSTIRSRSQVQRLAPLSREELSKLTGAEPWMVEAAQGRVNRVEQLREDNVQELRSAAFTLWDHLMEKRSLNDQLDSIKELTKDKQQSLFVVRLWQQLLRDSRFRKNQLEPIIHRDFLPLIESLSQSSAESIDELSMGCIQLEKDILGNLDRSLSFQSYCQRAQAVLGAHG